MSYDLIGDIHGCGDSLRALLAQLGYAPVDGVYRHPGRRAIFLGDFIDRGPQQRRVIDLVRPMIDSGSALAVMGNHEYNAIAYVTPDRQGEDFLRPNSVKNTRQHRAFLEAYGDRPADYAEVIDWFKTLPLWLDLEGLRVIHACWDADWIGRIRTFQAGADHLGDALLEASARDDQWQYDAIETLLKGMEIPLPPGVRYSDKEGTVREHMRVRWWDRDAATYHDAYMGSARDRANIPHDSIEGKHAIDYSPSEPPVFVGHYWLEGEPEPLAVNVACLDYSVARPDGKLVAYRWDGEQQLKRDNYVWVERLEE